jgi:hypothetical protein
MEDEGAGIDIGAVHHIELACRDQLEHTPENCEARLRLAWCLFLEAVHEAGRVRGVSAVVREMKDRGAQARAPGEPVREPDRLLRECLKHATAVRQLSPDPNDHVMVEQIRTLLVESGQGDAVRAAQAEGDRILKELTDAILRSG